MGKRMDIEERMRQAILQCGMSRAELSRRCGVAEAVLSFFVNGHRTLTLRTAAKVARALGLELRPVKGKATTEGR